MRQSLVFGLIVGFAVWLLSPVSIEADHGVARCGGTGMKACLAVISPIVRDLVQPGGEITWCVNPRGYQYGGFRNSRATVMANLAFDLRMTEREVPYPPNPTSQDCLIRNDMRDDHPCSGCGAHVYTHNKPVLIEYNAKAGYSRWESTLIHEDGHWACLLDEHYDKARFRSYILNFGVWIHGAPTAMDSGTPFLPQYSPLGITRLTEYDLDRCEEALGRDVGPPPPPPTCAPALEVPCWIDGRWRFHDGYSCAIVNEVCEYYDPDNRLAWTLRQPWGGWWSPLIEAWVPSGHEFHKFNRWYRAP